MNEVNIKKNIMFIENCISIKIFIVWYKCIIPNYIKLFFLDFKVLFL